MRWKSLKISINRGFFTAQYPWLDPDPNIELGSGSRQRFEYGSTRNRNAGRYGTRRKSLSGRFAACLGCAWWWWGPWRGATAGRTAGTPGHLSPAWRSAGSLPPHSLPTNMLVESKSFPPAWDQHRYCSNECYKSSFITSWHICSL